MKRNFIILLCCCFSITFAVTAGHTENFINVKSFPLIIDESEGKLNILPPQKALNISYCIDKSGFGNNYGSVVTAMQSASSAWGSVSAVSFVHNEDVDCSANTASVFFNVRPEALGEGVIAQAFYPDSQRADRELLIDNQAFSYGYFSEILTHELGHMLGFRHEHIRNTDMLAPIGFCRSEDGSWRAVTEYDPDSVMHYPYCEDLEGLPKSITNQDRSGAILVYGLHPSLIQVLCNF